MTSYVAVGSNLLCPQIRQILVVEVMADRDAEYEKNRAFWADVGARVLRDVSVIVSDPLCETLAPGPPRAEEQVERWEASCHG